MQYSVKRSFGWERRSCAWSPGFRDQPAQQWSALNTAQTESRLHLGGRGRLWFFRDRRPYPDSGHWSWRSPAHRGGIGETQAFARLGRVSRETRFPARMETLSAGAPSAKRCSPWKRALSDGGYLGRRAGQLCCERRRVSQRIPGLVRDGVRDLDVTTRRVTRWPRVSTRVAQGPHVGRSARRGARSRSTSPNDECRSASCGSGLHR